MSTKGGTDQSKKEEHAKLNKEAIQQIRKHRLIAKLDGQVLSL